MRFVIIVAALIHLSAAGAAGASVGRCCLKGEILVLNDAELKCRRPTNNQLQQRRLFDASRDDQANGLPRCGKHGHLRQILVDDVALNEVAADACLELFHDRASSLSFPVVVHCWPQPPPPTIRRIQHSRVILQAGSRSAPRIVQLRKCCPGSAAYDPERKLCYEASGADFRALFDRLPSLDFVDVHVHGPPRCHGAVLADFRVEQLYHSGTDTTSVITIGITQRGSLVNVTLSADTSCLDSHGDQLTVRLCRESDYCEENVCIRKCCDEGVEEKRCAAAASTLENFSYALANIKNYGLLMGIPCELVYDPDEEIETWWLDGMGNVNMEDNEDSFVEIFTHMNSCLEYERDERGFSPMLCLPEDAVDHTPPEKWTIGGSLQTISCFFLLLTFTVYCCLPTLQNLHGKTLMCHVASLCVAYAILAVTEFTTNSFGIWEDGIHDVACIVMGYVLLLAFLSAFFWLNVMCFDIWWTFLYVSMHIFDLQETEEYNALWLSTIPLFVCSNSACKHPSEIAPPNTCSYTRARARIQTQGKESSIREAKRHRQTSRFLAYCAYAWGSALCLVVLLLSLDLAGAVKDVVGKQRCWLEQHSTVHVVFFLLPVNLTVVANLAFFVVTARRCSKVKAEISRVMANDKSAKNFRSDRSRLMMNAKLFVVMGIPYLFENLEALLEHYNLMPDWSREVLYAVDVITSLQGVWIFILFVLKSKVYEALCRRVSSSPAMHKSRTGNTLSVNNNANQLRLRSSASNTSVTSCYLAN
ncbi:uncharacterized protein LOC131670748 [Phymastichus coffea]|uniref:uncharacterized protein LOC131670748 n=1 Tax=Phymastichus coffea TaxID=108790 RepID=UPI00273B6C82|nr:uncharacterized protein LOC131670748 [Phymastichus coffea]